MIGGFDLHSQVQMLDSPSPRTPQGGSDMQSVRQKLRESLTSALEMVVSKHLVKSVLGVVKEAKKDFGEGESPPKVRSTRAGPVQVRHKLQILSVRYTFIDMLNETYCFVMEVPEYFY